MSLPPIIDIVPSDRRIIGLSVDGLPTAVKKFFAWNNINQRFEFVAGAGAFSPIIVGEAAGDLLIFNATSGDWKNQPITGDITIDEGGITTIGNLKITNGMLFGAIDNSKLLTNPLARANMTGTQLAATISDFNTAVRLNRVEQLAIPLAALNMNTQKITNVVDPTNPQEVATKNYVDSAGSTNSFIIFTHVAPATSGNALFFIPFGAISGTLSGATESAQTSRVKSALTLIRHTAEVKTNGKNAVTKVTCRDDGVDIVGTDFSITASTTGEFDSGALTSVIAADSLICTERDTALSGSGTFAAQLTTEFKFS